MTETREAGDAGSNRGRTTLIVVALVLIAVVLMLVWIVFLRPETVVPDLLLKTDTETSEALEAAGLRVGSVAEVTTDTVGVGRVVAQFPPAGTSVKRNSTVDVTAAVASVPVAVPDLTGLDVEAATQVLEDAQLLVRRVDILETDDEVGKVVAQVPSAGTDWKTGQPVAIGVAAGPDDGTGTKVPDIYGDSFSTAIDSLSQVGLLGYGLTLDPEAVYTDEVDEQLPAAGVIVRQGTTVLFLLGDR